MSEDIVTRLHRHRCVSGIRTVIDDAADEIERLRAERDEARRMVCSAYAPQGRDIATERDWDCFKEER